MFHLIASLPFVSICFGHCIKWAISTPQKYRLVVGAAVLLLFLQSYRILKYLYVVRNNSLHASMDQKMEKVIYEARSFVGTKSFYVLGNYDILYFFLNQPPSVTPWYHLFPGIARLPGIQESLVSSLKKTDVPVIIYAPLERKTAFAAASVPEVLLRYVFSAYQYTNEQPLAPEVYFLVRRAAPE